MLPGGGGGFISGFHVYVERNVIWNLKVYYIYYLTLYFIEYIFVYIE